MKIKKTDTSNTFKQRFELINTEVLNIAYQNRYYYLLNKKCELLSDKNISIGTIFSATALFLSYLLYVFTFIFNSVLFKSGKIEGIINKGFIASVLIAPILFIIGVHWLYKDKKYIEYDLIIVDMLLRKIYS